MNEVYIYKLKSGETVIGEFVKAEVINERTGETAHMVRHPKVVGVHYNLTPWVIGCMDEVQPMSMKDMSLIIAGESIDPVLIEAYENCFTETDVVLQWFPV